MGAEPYSHPAALTVLIASSEEKKAMPPRKTKPRAPRSEAKREEEDLFDEAEESTEDTEDAIQEVATRLREKESALTPARRAAQEKHEREVLETAATISVEGAVKSIGDLKVTVDATIDKLSQALVDQAKKLTAVGEAVTIKQRTIAELHDIEIAADTLANLIRDYEEKKRTFEEEAASRRRDFERETQEAKAAWDKEKQRFQEELATDKVRTKKEWQREQEEYDYSLKTRRAREEQEYTAKREAELAKLAEERAKQEKALADREAQIAAREKEFATLQARVQGIEAELAKAVAQARDEATKAAEAKARQDAQLKAKEVEGNERLLKQRIETLELLIKEQAGRVELLQAELKDSTIKVRDIALRAIEGASGATALARVSEIALQQAKGTS
jgi:hypothetical protein